jgi:tRNA U34 5-carboxymethylaminomethyl modifying enzyme MnmG/GidA
MYLKVFVLKNNQIIVAGGGHAGIEAVLAIQKMGYSCAMVTMNRGAIGRLSCNHSTAIPHFLDS